MTKRIGALIALATLVLLTASGCALLGRPQPDALDGTSWILTSYRTSRPLPGAIPIARFADGQISGSTGCNHFSGEYSIEDGAISIGPLAATEMACLTPAGAMDQERAVLDLLQGAETFQIDNKGGLIIGAGHETMVFAPVATSP